MEDLEDGGGQAGWPPPAGWKSDGRWRPSAGAFGDRKTWGLGDGGTRRPGDDRGQNGGKGN